MSVFRRRRADEEVEIPAPGAASSQPIVERTESNPAPRPPTPTPVRRQPMTPVSHVPPHIERALITLTGKMQQCVERLDILERRIDELAELVANTPSHSDVLEVRLHSAKLAAELARTTVELRGEIGLANEETRRAVRAARNTEAPTEPTVSLPVDLEVEPSPAVDLTTETQRKNNWSQSA